MKTGTKITIAFLVGFFLGVTGTVVYIHHCFRYAWANSGNHKHALETLGSKLNLTPDQKTKIEQIFDATSPTMDSLRLETNAKLKIIRDNTFTEIRDTLTADQQNKFDALKAQWDRKISVGKRGWDIPGFHPPPSIPGAVCSPVPTNTSLPTSI